jgi:hypothetical protein
MSNETKEITNPIKNDLVSNLQQTEILTQSDWSNLESAKSFIVDNFAKVPMYRPLPVKLFGVLNDKDFPSTEAKFWQCKVEAEVHAEQLMNDIHDLESMKIAIEKANYILDNMEHRKSKIETPEEMVEIDFDIREHKINMSRLQFKYLKLQKQIKYRIEEVYEWKKITEALLGTGHNVNTQDFVEHYVNKMKYKLLDSANKITDKNSSEYQELIKQSDNLGKIIQAIKVKQVH